MSIMLIIRGFIGARGIMLCKSTFASVVNIYQKYIQNYLLAAKYFNVTFTGYFLFWEKTNT